METKTITVFPEFDSLNEGKTFMKTYEKPISYFAKDIYYNATGSKSDVANIYHETAPKEILASTYPEGNEDTVDGVLYVNEGFLKYNKEVENIEE